MYVKTYDEVALPPFPQIYESEVAQLPLFPSTVIQTDQLIIEVAKCLTQTPFREIRLIYCDPPTRTVRVLCSKFQEDQKFYHIFQQVEETTGWRVKVDVWEEIASIIAYPITYPSSAKEEGISLNSGNAHILHRKVNSQDNLMENTIKNSDLEKDFKRTIEELLNKIGKQLQSSHFQSSQNHFRIIVPGVTEQEKQILRSKFQDKHPGFKLGVAAHP